MSNVFYIDDHRKPSDEAEDGVKPQHAALAPGPLTARTRLGTQLSGNPAVIPKSPVKSVEVRRRILFRPPQPPPPELNTLLIATPIALHSISWGRNAWNSTWIQRYRRGTLCESREASRRYVDKNRVQGSVYRETIMPGWHLQFDGRAYLVCEINTRRPFERLITPEFVTKGVVEREALRLLETSSEIWRGPVPNRHSIIVQQTHLPVSVFAGWSNRTPHHMRFCAPGRYERVIDGKHWNFLPSAVQKGLEYDVGPFEALLAWLSTNIK